MQISHLPEVLGRNEAFGVLPPEEMARLGRALEPLAFRLGDVVSEGTAADRALYIVYAGRARIVEEDTSGNQVTLSLLGIGDTFGEHSLLANRPNPTVRAASDLVVLRLDEERFHQIASSHPEFREILDLRLREGEELAFLRRLSLLSHLKLPELRRIAARLERVELNPGETLFREADSADSAYIVREGRLRLTREFHGTTRQLAIIKPGELVGEMGLLYGTPRVATGIALTPVVALRLTRDVFDEVLSDDEKKAVTLQEATNRLLMLETYEADSVSSGPQSRIELRVKWMKAPGASILGRAWPIVSVDRAEISGLACLEMAEAHYGKSGVTRAEVDRRASDSASEKLESLSRTAEDLGYVTRLMAIEPGKLGDLPLPAVIEVESGEMALVYVVRRGQVVLGDPLRGLRQIALDELTKDWDGRALALSHLPAARFADLRTGAIFRQFLPFARPHATLLVWIALVSLLVQMFGLAAPLFSKVIIDRVLVNFDAALLHLLLLGMLLVTAFQMAASSLREYLTAHVMRRMSSAIQLRFFHHILSLPMAALGRFGTGDFIVRLQENEKLLRLVSDAGFRVILSSVMIALNFVLLFLLSSQLAPVALAFVAAYATLILISSPILRAANSRVFDARSDTESHFIESVTGIETVKALALEPHTYSRGFRFIDRLKDSEFHEATVSFHVAQFGVLLSQAATVVVLGWGASLALEGEITTGELVAFHALLGATLAPLTSLVGVWDQLQEIRISFERTSDVLRIDPEPVTPNAAVFPIRGDVTLEDVSFRYADDAEPVLQNVSLSVRAGQKVALVGRSGSGKTTLAGLLLNLYQPSAGRILVDEVEINTIRRSALRRQIGFVEQQPYLFSGTIRENIARADPGAGIEAIVAAATLAGAHEFIQRLPLGYDTQIGERGMTLSGGQKQRLVIARALLNNPRMLILDEATSALDTESEQVIQRNLDAIMAGKTSFTIAHRLSTVTNADRIVVLDQGRVVEEGTHTQLMEQRGLYHYLATAAG